MEIIKVLDPRLQFPDSNKLLALSGSSSINCYQFLSNQISNTGVTITANPASLRVACDSNLILRMKFSVTFNGTNTSAQPLVIPTLVAPSFMPLQQIISTSSMSVNGVTTSLQGTNLFMPALMSAYQSDVYHDIHKEYSITPCMPDTSTSFLTLPISATSIINPLASSLDQTIKTPRGAHIGWQPVSNVPGATTSTFTLECAEAIVLSPFQFGKGSFDAKALPYINTLLYNATFGNLVRVVSVAYPPAPGTDIPTYALPDGSGTVALTSIVVNVMKAEILMQNYSMDHDVPKPMTSIREFNQLIDYPTTSFTPLLPGQNITISSQTLTLSSIPRAMYIFAPCMPDTYIMSGTPSSATIPVGFLQFAGAGGYNGNSGAYPLSINFDNGNMISNFTMLDLYKASVKNGSCQDFTDFIGNGTLAPYSTGRGTLIKLVFGEDIPLAQGLTVGCSGKYTFVATASVYNQTQRINATPVLHLVGVYDGLTLTTDNAITTFNQASFSPEQAARTHISTNIHFTPERKLFGGSFWDTLKSGFNKVSDFLKKTKVISTVAKALPGYGPTIGNAAEKLGYGCGGSRGYTRRPKPRMRAGGNIEYDDSYQDSAAASFQDSEDEEEYDD